ncbi:MAG: metal transporter [Thermoleophilia bacterium]|nr:metal transporter [Thermoleophilia bacterium]MDH4339547.1 metal transporter [Thermoleophilia bacterium]MDH5279903.1 metal transporter [Thermoleophilia bacterium]
MEAGSATSRARVGWRLWTVVPVLLLALVVGLVVTFSSSLVDLVGSNPPPADEFDIRRVEFSPGEIRITVRNPQRDELTIANVNVDDAIVPFTVDGSTTLGRLRSSTIVVPYDWVPADPITVGVTSSTGIETVKEIPAAVETPVPSVEGFLGYALIGVLVGVLPVSLGLLWLPALRHAGPAWLSAFMAFTAGLLSFLGLEALSESFQLQTALPSALGGTGLILLGVALSFLGMTALAGRLTGGSAATGLALALLVAIGIGLHNLGEGLAIGASFALGELQLGTFLIVGFMIHNITEGLGIATPVAKTRVTILTLAGLALVAGAPTILGTWIGGYTSSDVLGVLFFAIAAGAAFQVVVEVGRYVARHAPGGLKSGYAIGGFLAGIATMFATGVLAG